MNLRSKKALCTVLPSVSVTKRRIRAGANGTPTNTNVRYPHTLLQRTRLSLCVPFFMSIFTASGPRALFFDMKRLNCLPVILALISTTSVAEQDLPTYKSIPIWPEDGIIPEGMAASICVLGSRCRPNGARVSDAPRTGGCSTLSRAFPDRAV